MVLETSPFSAIHRHAVANGYSSTEEFDDASSELTPMQLLALATRKRHELYRRKVRDYRRVLLHTDMMRQLCRYLGDEEEHARRPSRKSRSRRRTASALGKRKYSAEPAYVQPTATPADDDTGRRSESDSSSDSDSPPSPPSAEEQYAMDDDVEPQAPVVPQSLLDAAVEPSEPYAPMEDDADEPDPNAPAVYTLLEAAEPPERKRAKLDDSAGAVADGNDSFGLDALFAGLHAAEEKPNAADAEHTVPNAYPSAIEPCTCDLSNSHCLGYCAHCPIWVSRPFLFM
ncbi:hypothetical protein AAVH_18709 [Aphelenchoides avenae]|nr:hypothetical protein AAVH_18709 [Aphelenchus avenae]